MCHSFYIDDNRFAPNEIGAHWIYGGAAIKISWPIPIDNGKRAYRLSWRFLFPLVFFLLHLEVDRSATKTLIIDLCVCDESRRDWNVFCDRPRNGRNLKLKLFARKPDTGPATVCHGRKLFIIPYIIFFDRGDLWHSHFADKKKITSAECQFTDWRKRGTATIAAGHLIVAARS